MNDLKQTLEHVCDYTIAKEYGIPPVDGPFFQWIPEKGMQSLPLYLNTARDHHYIDMQYDLFDWQQGVGFFALCLAGEALETDKYAAFVQHWIDWQLSRGAVPKTVNATAPYLSMLYLYQKQQQPAYAQLCQQRASYCLHDAPRTADGVLEHTVNDMPAEFSSQVWADTLFMAALFMARYGKAFEELSYVEEAVSQLMQHYQYLRDPETGLLFHAYNARTRNHMSAVRWGRANAWGILAHLFIAECLPEDHPARADMAKQFEAHMMALAARQTPSGAFHTVLDWEESYEETTITAAFIFACLRGYRAGWLDQRFLGYAEKAKDFLLRHIREDGLVLQCSGGTPVMCSAQAYQEIPLVPSYYGQGLAILALLALLEQD